MSNIEVWKKVIGFEEFYEVSNKGAVRNLDREWVGGNGSIHKSKSYLMSTPPAKSTGYVLVGFRRPSQKQKRFSVHRLVAELFVEKVAGKDQVNHIDGDKTNNSAENLEWCSPKENIAHAFSMGLKKGRKGTRHHNVVLTEHDVIRIRENAISRTITQRNMGLLYGISQAHISNIVMRKTWKHL